MKKSLALHKGNAPGHPVAATKIRADFRMRAGPGSPVEAVHLHHRHCSRPPRSPQPGRVRGNCSDLGTRDPLLKKLRKTFVFGPGGIAALGPLSYAQLRSGFRTAPPGSVPGPSHRYIQDGPGWVKSGYFMQSMLLESLGRGNGPEMDFQGRFPVWRQPALPAELGEDQRRSRRDAPQDENGLP